MTTIYTNMDWKSTPSYNPANSTAGEPDAETGIVKCQPRTTARTDELEINFCGNLPEEQADKIRGYANAVKDARLLAAPSDISAESSKDTDRTTYIVAESPEAADTASDISADSSEFFSGVRFIHHTLDAYDRTAVASDGSTFSVRYAYSKDGKECRGNYLSEIKDAVAGTVDSLEDAAYTINLKADITSYFSTASSLKADKYAIYRACQSAYKEIEQNIADGKADPTANLKTKVTINGTEWNFSELVNTVEKINKSFEYFDTHITLDYADYARLGASKAAVTDWAGKNLSEEKQSVVANALNARAQTYVQRERESLEESREHWDLPGVVIPGEKAKYYDSIVLSASNKEVREKIMKLFEETDYRSPSSVSKTINRFKDIMLPIMIAFGGTQGASGSVDYAVKDMYKYIADLFGGSARGLNVSV